MARESKAPETKQGRDVQHQDVQPKSDEDILRDAVMQAIREGKTKEAVDLLNDGAERFGWRPERLQPKPWLKQ